MKLTLAFLGLLGSMVFSGVVAAQDPPPKLATDQLVGPIKTVEQIIIGYSFHDGNLFETGRLLFRKTNYDQDGNRIEQITYRNGGEIMEKLVYTYDILKRNTGYEEYHSLKGPTLLGPRKHTYTLDANGRPVEFVLYEQDGTSGSHFAYSYDDRGNKIGECFKILSDRCSSGLVYTYDDKGHMLSQASYNNDIVQWKTTSTYDRSGHQIEWLQYQSDVLRYKRTSKYDDQGRILEVETSEFNKPPNSFSDHAPVPGKIVYSYGERSQEIANYNADGSLTSRQIVAFDEKSNEVNREFFRDDSARKLGAVDSAENNQTVGSSQNKIEYDSHGNWIRKTYLRWPAGAKQAVPSSAEHRIITYYEEK